MTRVGIVVPTIGQRPEYLPLALASIKNAVNHPDDVYLILIGHKEFDPKPYLNLIDEYQVEATKNLPAKINAGLRSLPKDIQYFNWLGDDDLLTPGSLTKALERITQPDNPVLVYGGCEYIDPMGKVIWNNKSGPWATALLRFGPQLIPQPGSLYERAAFEKVNGLSTDFGWAFDFELFYSLSQIGRTAYLNTPLAQFRWHPGSLSVSRRRESVAEASTVRVSHLPSWLKPFSPVWEWPVRQATYYAGIRVSKKLSSN